MEIGYRVLKPAHPIRGNTSVADTTRKHMDYNGKYQPFTSMVSDGARLPIHVGSLALVGY